ncbi:unnamed protein product [Amoebophrya sp. A120]|nr:unnamed protein product [Amoebophrya sp. A120]|eukprot:GSA120T00008212001.1
MSTSGLGLAVSGAPHTTSSIGTNQYPDLQVLPRRRIYRKDPFLGRDVRKSDHKPYVELFRECKEKNRLTLGAKLSKQFLQNGPVVCTGGDGMSSASVMSATARPAVVPRRMRSEPAGNKLNVKNASSKKPVLLKLNKAAVVATKADNAKSRSAKMEQERPQHSTNYTSEQQNDAALLDQQLHSLPSTQFATPRGGLQQPLELPPAETQFFTYLSDLHTTTSTTTSATKHDRPLPFSHGAEQGGLVAQDPQREEAEDGDQVRLASQASTTLLEDGINKTTSTISTYSMAKTNSMNRTTTSSTAGSPSKFIMKEAEALFTTSAIDEIMEEKYGHVASSNRDSDDWVVLELEDCAGATAGAENYDVEQMFLAGFLRDESEKHARLLEEEQAAMVLEDQDAGVFVPVLDRQNKIYDKDFNLPSVNIQPVPVKMNLDLHPQPSQKLFSPLKQHKASTSPTVKHLRAVQGTTVFDYQPIARKNHSTQSGAVVPPVSPVVTVGGNKMNKDSSSGWLDQESVSLSSPMAKRQGNENSQSAGRVVTNKKSKKLMQQAKANLNVNSSSKDQQQQQSHQHHQLGRRYDSVEDEMKTEVIDLIGLEQKDAIPATLSAEKLFEENFHQHQMEKTDTPHFGSDNGADMVAVANRAAAATAAAGNNGDIKLPQYKSNTAQLLSSYGLPVEPHELPSAGAARMQMLTSKKGTSTTPDHGQLLLPAPVPVIGASNVLTSAASFCTVMPTTTLASAHQHDQQTSSTGVENNLPYDKNRSTSPLKDYGMKFRQTLNFPVFQVPTLHLLPTPNVVGQVVMQPGYDTTSFAINPNRMASCNVVGSTASLPAFGRPASTSSMPHVDHQQQQSFHPIVLKTQLPASPRVDTLNKSCSIVIPEKDLAHYQQNCAAVPPRPVQHLLQNDQKDNYLDVSPGLPRKEQSCSVKEQTSKHNSNGAVYLPATESEALYLKELTEEAEVLIHRIVERESPRMGMKF